MFETFYMEIERDGWVSSVQVYVKRFMSKFICNREKHDWGGGRQTIPLVLATMLRVWCFSHSFMSIHHFFL